MILFANNNETIRYSKGRLLYETDGFNASVWVTSNVLLRLALVSKLLTRLLRLYPCNFCQLDDSAFVFNFNKCFYRFEPSKKKVAFLSYVVGSNPLNALLEDGVLFYGEYRSNTDRTPVSIYRSHDQGVSWDAVYTFSEVRHIHGVFYDRYEDVFWVTTGDADRESGIFRCSKHFLNVTPVLTGSQQYRAVQLGITKDYIYFGSDSPLEKNHLYQFSKCTGLCKPLAEVSGSIFFCKKLGSKFFFSTAVEPSEVNTHQYAQCWEVDGSAVRLVLELKKDILSKKYFQYGQLRFSDGDGSGVYVNPIALSSSSSYMQLQ